MDIEDLKTMTIEELQLCVARAESRAAMHESYGRVHSAQLERDYADDYAREIQRRLQAQVAGHER